MTENFENVQWLAIVQIHQMAPKRQKKAPELTLVFWSHSLESDTQWSVLRTDSITEKTLIANPVKVGMIEHSDPKIRNPKYQWQKYLGRVIHLSGKLKLHFYCYHLHTFKVFLCLLDNMAELETRGPLRIETAKQLLSLCRTEDSPQSTSLCRSLSDSSGRSKGDMINGPAANSSHAMPQSVETECEQYDVS